MSTKKPVAKKPVAKKPVAKKPGDDKLLYTIRLEAASIDKLHAIAKKQGATHAEVARAALNRYVASAK